jgi:IS605 OrfB family transposase
VKIQKTLSLKILRPFYLPEVEMEIKLEKEKRKENGGSGSLESHYFKQLKAKYPKIVTNNEFFPLLSKMQRNISEAYNRSISQLYHRIIVKEERISTAKALSEGPYRDFKSIFNSYIALGLRQKIQSNFRRKDLKASRTTLPTVKSDRFPISIYKQVYKNSGGFKIHESIDGDFIIELPLLEYFVTGINGRSFVEIIEPPSIKNVPVILSTKRRKKMEQWVKGKGTNDEIKRVVSGEYKISWLEVTKRTRAGKHDDWFVNFSIRYDKKEEGINPSVLGGIEIGEFCPIVCAVSNSLQRHYVNKSDIIAFNKRAMARKRTIIRQNAFKRAGHGSKNKLKLITVLRERNERFRKSIMYRWAKEIAEFYKSQNAAIVQMKNLDGIKEKETYFDRVLNTSWNYSQLQQIIKNKLMENGIQVRYVSSQNTSGRCHGCGHVNSYFTFEYRKKNNWPPFKCGQCKEVECNWDFNEAKNIANYNSRAESENIVAYGF